jgi:hypothetical protein
MARKEEFKLSKEDLYKEVLKCGKSPIYFINNYVKIPHVLKGMLPFKMYKFQEKLVEDLISNRFNVVLKARQLGVSTIIAAYCAWMMLFYRDREILVIATKFKTAANLVKKVKSIVEYLPEYIRMANIKVDNAASFELDNGSKIQPSASTLDAGRSLSLSLLVIDEAAHVTGLEEIWAAIYPTLSTGGSCIMASTPAGVGNFFHKTYTEAENKVNDFNPICLPWDVHPERDREWFEKETKNMSQRDIAQELLCNFNMSGETVFDGKNIERIKKKLKDPVYKTGFDRNFWIWEEFKQGENYILSGDVSRGDGADYSVFHIFKLSTMEIVGEYQGKLTPDLFANLLFQVGKEYGNCMLVIENNTIGFAVLSKLEEMKYPNIFYSTKSTHEFIDSYQAENKSGVTAGFTVTLKTRPLIIAKMEEYIRNNLITIYSVRLTNEMNTFVWNNGRPEAMRSYNDDLIMACAIGCWVKDTVLTINQRDLEYKKAFLDCVTVKRTTLDTSMNRLDSRTREALREQQQTMNDFPWIFVK